MYQAKSTILEQDRIIHFVLMESGQSLSGERFCQLLATKADFRLFLHQLLKALPFDAFFWELRPFDQHTFQEEFEFVVVKSKRLSEKSPNARAFRAYFEGKKEPVLSFPNLGKDALLLVPTPQDKQEHYTHIGKFVREAPQAQVDQLLQAIGLAFPQELSKGKRWLSTSGLGVYWLHIRIDKFPKYYSYQAYRNG